MTPTEPGSKPIWVMNSFSTGTQSIIPCSPTATCKGSSRRARVRWGRRDGGRDGGRGADPSSPSPRPSRRANRSASCSRNLARARFRIARCCSGVTPSCAPTSAALRPRTSRAITTSRQVRGSSSSAAASVSLRVGVGGLDRRPGAGERAPVPGAGLGGALEARLVDRRRRREPPAPAGEPIARGLAPQDGVRGRRASQAFIAEPSRRSGSGAAAAAVGGNCWARPPGAHGAHRLSTLSRLPKEPSQPSGPAYISAPPACQERSQDRGAGGAVATA